MDIHSVGIRELADRASSVVSEVETTGHAVLVTRHGRPIAVLSAIDEDALYDYILANAPEYVQGMRDADDRYDRGESDSRPLHEVLAELDAEDAGQAASA
jgi:prevent-host-death family protein